MGRQEPGEEKTGEEDGVVLGWGGKRQGEKEKRRVAMADLGAAEGLADALGDDDLHEAVIKEEGHARGDALDKRGLHGRV